MPGIGHPVHKPIDPRTPLLFGIAGENGFRGRYVALLEKIASEAEARSKRNLPINATGAIGALMLELGFPWQICRGIAVISRAVGLVGHIAEEMRNPIARELWERARARGDGRRNGENLTAGEARCDYSRHSGPSTLKPSSLSIGGE